MATSQVITEDQIEQFLQLPIPANPRFINLTGRPFGSWTVICYAGKDGKQQMWVCRCKCGTICRVRGNSMKQCKTNSCKRCANLECNLRHGLSYSSEYRCWGGMIKRCTNPKATGYRNYGGRDICVCARWSGPGGFANFYADMGPKPAWAHDIDREDNNGDYEPGNCRWTTRKVNSRNKRSNRLVTFMGQTKPVVEWAEELADSLDLTPGGIRLRLRYGWPVEKAFTTPRVK